MLVIAGIVVLSCEPSAAPGQRLAAGAGLALVAALGFGLFIVGLDAGADASAPWAVVAARPTSVTLAVSPLRSSCPPAPVAFAVTLGAAGVVAVLSALYPLATVVLARILLPRTARPIEACGRSRRARRRNARRGGLSGDGTASRETGRDAADLPAAAGRADQSRNPRLRSRDRSGRRGRRRRGAKRARHRNRGRSGCVRRRGDDRVRPGVSGTRQDGARIPRSSGDRRPRRRPARPRRVARHRQRCVRADRGHRLRLDVLRSARPRVDARGGRSRRASPGRSTWQPW